MGSKRSNRKKKKNLFKRKLLLLLLIIIIVGVLGLFIFNNNLFNKVIPSYDMYLAGNNTKVEVYTLKEDILSDAIEMSRGVKVSTKNNYVTVNDTKYKEVFLNNKTYYVLDNYLVKNKKDVIKEDKMYVRIPSTIIENINDSKIVDMTNKGEEVQVIGYDSYDKDGVVNRYKIKVGEKEGYVEGKYLEFDLEEAKKNYHQDLYDNIYSKVNNYYDGGDASKLDYYPHDSVTFSDNVMPDGVYTLYLNI